MSGIALITEACIGTKDRACVDVCCVRCICPDPGSTDSTRRLDHTHGTWRGQP